MVYVVFRQRRKGHNRTNMKKHLSVLVAVFAIGCADVGSDDTALLTGGEGALAYDYDQDKDYDHEETPPHEEEDAGYQHPEEPVCEDVWVPGDTSDAIDLHCPQGGKVGAIKVDFDCDSVTILSCKDISNVVLVLADGSHHKTEYKSGTSVVLMDEQEIVAVYVKAGNNKSGDGPGYGEKFTSAGGECGHNECVPVEEDCPDDKDDGHDYDDKDDGDHHYYH